MPERTGLTGGRGVLGRRIVEAFARQGVEVDSFPGDVRDVEAFRSWIGGLSHLVHAAAVVPVNQVSAEPSSAIAVNVGGTATAAQACAANGVRLTYISTSHVYRPSDAALAEDHPIEPASLYGLTKYQGEQWVRSYCSDALILRLFSYFDERQAVSYLVPSLRKRISEAAAGATLPLMGAASIRDIATAGWLGEASVALVLGGQTGTYNVSAGCAESVRDIAVSLSRAMGRADITWQADGSAGNVLRADRSRLEAAAPALPTFDLGEALVRFGASGEQ